MIPLRDNIPSHTTPVVNYTLIGVNVLVFLFELSLGTELQKWVHVFGMVPERIVYIVFNAPQYFYIALISLFSSMFLHGGFLHIIGNMLFLYIFGDNVEDALGHVRYLVFYLGSGIAASMAQLIVHPGSQIPTIGASGAIAGVMGAYFLLYPRSKVLTLIPIFFFFQVFEIPAVIFLGLWFLIQFFLGSFSIAGATGSAGVAFWAHIGGFAVGAGYIFLRYGGTVRRNFAR
ncbi:MAG: rhomboid family intramembrane serine protease [Deltaproteobacteria bacterium]|nr:rhomboid family intramembrane serine protease [Deltaproteobacteria bacterium]